MPRMDPKKLLNCLSVVLLPNGGIKSTDEVERLAKLMTQYSKKLVSKCIYIQILKCTETTLLDIFMGSGGWRLLHMWLTEGIAAKNWPLVKELLELLLLCPVDIDRLKSNNCPKLVKELSKDENDFVIKALASKLVEQWLKTVKGEQSHPVSISDIPKIVSETCNEIKSHGMLDGSNDVTDDDTKLSELQTDKELNNSEFNTHETTHNNSTENNSDINDEKSDTNKEFETLPVLKISLKNGKQVLTQVDENSKSSESSELNPEIKDSNKSKNKDKTNEKRSSDSSKSSSSKHSSKSKSSSDRHHKESRHSSSSRDKDRKRDKDRHSSSSSSSKSKSSSSSSSSSKKTSSSSSRPKDDKKSETSIDKEKNKDRDKKVLDKEKSSLHSSDKSLSPSIKKLGKIPKLGEVKREKPSISIEVRKPEDPKPKTVKTFHSRFRKHGLEEEIQPPPSRASVLTKKQLPPLPPTVSIPKRPSPIHNETPPEKKPKTLEIEKPGAIKLIPPKPKPMVLQESDLFMDALNASTTNKKEPKKRKRRMSGSKDGTSNESSPPNTPTNESKSVPPRFYQDTLDEEESKKKITEKEGDVTQNEEKENIVSEIEEQMDLEPHTRTVNGLKGVLCYHRRKGPKKSIKWKPDTELEEIQYFELDETERVNVTKTFTDMKHLEMIHEREAFQKARNLTNDDVMEEKTVWKNLIFIDCGDQVVVEYGKNSKEKDIQAIRQKGTLQPLYFHKSMIPDSPFEPDIETHTYSEPTPIPLDDVTGNVSDFRNMPWPEPKGHPPPNTTNLNVPPMFPTNIPQFPNNFPPNQFPPGPGFQGQPLLPGDWQNNVPPVLPNGLPGSMGPPVMPPNGMPPGNMPRMMVPNENMMMGQKMFGGPNPMFPGPPDGFNMPQNIFPGDFNMAGPQGPPGPDSFSVPNNFRGAMRGRAPNGHWRGNGGFDGPPRGRGGNRGGRKAVCIHFQRKGSCRQGDSCSFLHPGVNCPY